MERVSLRDLVYLCLKVLASELPEKHDKVARYLCGSRGASSAECIQWQVMGLSAQGPGVWKLYGRAYGRFTDDYQEEELLIKEGELHLLPNGVVLVEDETIQRLIEDSGVLKTALTGGDIGRGVETACARWLDEATRKWLRSQVEEAFLGTEVLWAADCSIEPIGLGPTLADGLVGMGGLAAFWAARLCSKSVACREGLRETVAAGSFEELERLVCDSGKCLAALYSGDSARLWYASALVHAFLKSNLDWGLMCGDSGAVISGEDSLCGVKELLTGEDCWLHQQGGAVIPGNGWELLDKLVEFRGPVEEGFAAIVNWSRAASLQSAQC